MNLEIYFFTISRFLCAAQLAEMSRRNFFEKDLDYYALELLLQDRSEIIHASFFLSVSPSLLNTSFIKLRWSMTGNCNITRDHIFLFLFFLLFFFLIVARK